MPVRSLRPTGPIGWAIALLSLLVVAPAASAQDWSDLTALERSADPQLRPRVEPKALPTPADSLRVLVIGDSWAQYMWDDGSHDDLLDRFGLADARALSISRGDDPGPGHTGPEVAVSGSEARHWADTANYPWLQNSVDLLQQNPSIEWVMLSIGGNDMLAGRSDGGWYKDMDLDVPGSEEAVFQLLEQNTAFVLDTLLAVRPDLKVLLSSYDYPNFDVGFWCFVYACPKREDLSRDPDNDLVTDAELNAMMVQLEERRRDWCAVRERVVYDNSIGMMHYVYGDGVSGPRVLAEPGIVDPLYEPLPGGNPLRPTLRDAFRQPGGIDADPIHLDFEGYQIKIAHQTEAHFLGAWREEPASSVASVGGSEDGWADGVSSGIEGLRVGDALDGPVSAILSFDTSAVPMGAELTRAAVWLTRSGAESANPFETGALGPPVVDVKAGVLGPTAQVEPADATAPADVSDCATVHGSVRADGYALRLELDAAALAAMQGQSRVQIRLGFAQTDAGTDLVYFHDGDAGAPALSTVATFAEAVGSAQPRLDLHYDPATAVAGGTPRRDGARLRLSAPVPNPFNPSTRIAFWLAEHESDVRLEIFDARGRRVVTLLRGALAAGDHELRWRGLDERGARVASGLYLLRLRTATASTARKLVLAQ